MKYNRTVLVTTDTRQFYICGYGRSPRDTLTRLRVARTNEQVEQSLKRPLMNEIRLLDLFQCAFRRRSVIGA